MMNNKIFMNISIKELTDYAHAVFCFFLQSWHHVKRYLKNSLQDVDVDGLNGK